MCNDSAGGERARLAIRTPIGAITLEEENGAIVRLYLPGETGGENEAGGAHSALLSRAERQLNEYFAGTRRAVGMANHRNKLSILIPCHRVVGANGRLTGYGGGLAAKRRLPALEGAAAANWED